MTHVIIDSNVVFAGLLAKHSKIRETLTNRNLKFYSPKFLFVEIFKHKETIVKKSKATEDEVYELLNITLHYINFIDEDTITTHSYFKAFNLCKDVDEKDTPFVAFALEFKCKLWTRDIELINGLSSRGFNDFFDESKF